MNEIRPLAGRGRSIAVLGLSLIVLGTFAFVLSAAKSPDPATTAATPAIETALRAAIGDVYGAATFGPIAAKQELPGAKVAALSGAKVAALHVSLDRQLTAHMTGPALTKYRTSLSAAIDRESDGNHLMVVSGGIKGMQVATLSVDGDTAEAQGRALSWISWLDPVTGASANPQAWETFSAKLVFANGAWLVSDLSLQRETPGP